MTNRKLYTLYRLAPKLMTFLDDLEQPFHALFQKYVLFLQPATEISTKI